MHLRVFWQLRAGLILALAATALASPQVPTSYAQDARSTESVGIAPDALPPAPLASVLAEGERLESLRRWGEALTHYENALRDYPADETLVRREDLAKLHFSLDRRYADRSYVDSLQAFTPQQAVGLYLELLRKINTHYVATPPWQKLAARGITAVDLALLDSSFCSANGVNLTTEQLAPARRELYQLTTQRMISGPEDLSALAAEAARVIEARCGLRQTASLL
jgi:carboxyl-terminal processing protease